MYVVMGSTGHIGRALVERLHSQGKPLIAITHDVAQAQTLEARGVSAEAVDIFDVDSLRRVLQRGSRAYLLNPPAAVSGDTDAEEHRSQRSILQALDGLRLEKVVLASTYGARAGNRLGDLSTLFDFERSLQEQPIPHCVLRSAYYMSNWDPLLESARRGQLPTLFPSHLALPMVVPKDIAAVAADLLASPPEKRHTIHHVEGPQHYAPLDVAGAFQAALGHAVVVNEIPRPKWREYYGSLGFSSAAAESYSRMRQVTIDEPAPVPRDAVKGSTSLQSYIRALVEQS